MNREIWSLATARVMVQNQKDVHAAKQKHIILKPSQPRLRTWSLYVGTQHMASSVMTEEDICFPDVGSAYLICSGDNDVVSFPTMSVEEELR